MEAETRQTIIDYNIQYFSHPLFHFLNPLSNTEGINVSRSIPVEKFLRKASRIIRGHYDRLMLEAVKVKMNNDEWYDVYIFNSFNNMIYMDSLDKDDLNKLVRALNILCTVEDQVNFPDGFMIKFKNCR